ncbi:SMP-30/gluconolactonase/LRE family protein [Acetobacter sp. LMG 1636]|uniref:SMP-30/gluconolactonase/LRE family protein n=1 Tax=Acetobacter fallax TaxID=1737473 RepID=A0ABX0K3T2_9PROT|nr:SMP-30/gluconolactonase/LRE family protein [Acetobacter fallax]NHO30994.1 SMP-30/gluconolactonase/LRE family protein [Acetobacter fallax]NHO34551.1 SMP-30/gluconolactonase/LRE family protein [Acetobacter fallax]
MPRDRFAPTCFDPAFSGVIPDLADTERLVTGTAWAEGPVWFGDGRYLLWSDIPNNRILRWSEETRRSSVFRSPSHHANGNTRDREGRLITCEHETRRVTRTEYDGRITVLADRFEGKRLNSPNDVVVGPDGSVWFSDPDYGLNSHYEGGGGEAECPVALYRIDPGGGVHLMDDGFINPNGLCFSPDRRTLYVIDTGAQPNIIRACALNSGHDRITSHRVLITAPPGEAGDGFRCDAAGNLWCGWGGPAGQNGVKIFGSDGALRAFIPLPERCANLCFGGVRRNRLFMAASHGLYALHVNAQGDVTV